ncbi:lipid A deacylase LpxR family protein [Helicobacter muridarum]|uniref:Lipid A deacylase LpxR family protein n=1 Tax=Helicobacter muridarum TaxID=216 RepID=A0A377PWT5_9HELI|nr:lipid A deacylase LpxR family protein [Helicobacter muridarum]TLE00932.1 lipid A deacylase LpxR family protein [Helicobacter muridarum]STQ86711.1 putative outer membrane protein [Helicobacter muridarum]
MNIKIIIIYVCLCIKVLASDKHSITIHTENDAYYSPTDYDRYYTAGHNITYNSKGFYNSWFKHIGFIHYLADLNRSAFSIGLNQEIYTADDKKSIIPSTNDHLYGGYLYGNFTIYNYNDNFIESIGLDLGIVGKYSLAKETQKFIHKLLNFNYPKGWDTQISNEIIINLYHKLHYRFSIIKNIAELIPYSEIALGNAYTHALLGINLRVGYGLSNDFGITKIRYGHVGKSTIGNGFRIYLAGGINEKVVIRNIFLQGNTFVNGKKSSLQINKFVYEAQIGFLIGYAGWSISYLYSYRQKEFLTQKEPIGYAGLRLEIAF